MEGECRRVRKEFKASLGPCGLYHNKKDVVDKTWLLFGHFLTCEIKHVINKSVRKKVERAVDSRGRKGQDGSGRQSQEDWAIFRRVLKHLVSKA